MELELPNHNWQLRCALWQRVHGRCNREEEAYCAERNIRVDHGHFVELELV